MFGLDGVHLGPLAGVLLLATRFGALLLMSPPIGGRSVPAMVRLAVVITLAVCFASISADSGATPVVDWTLWSFVAALAIEAAIGATMAVGLQLAFAAFAIGARLVDTQIGFGIGQVVNPLTRQPQPILTGLFGQFALVLFFSTDAPHGLLRGLALSVEAYPPGAHWAPSLALGAVTMQASGLFALGFAIVAPVVICLLLVDLGLGLLSRTLPQMNMFAMGVPVKVVVGLAALAAWTVGSLGLMTRTHRVLFQGWEAMFR